jgi:hypothetical protein
MAFWSMLCVTLSGFVGRYLYSQIPRNLNAAELSMKEMLEVKNSLRQKLAEQKLSFGSRLESVFGLPTPSDVHHMPMFVALVYMLLIDLKRPFQLSLLRLQATRIGSWIGSFYGLRTTGDVRLEGAILVARKQAALSKRILFLSRTQQIFNMWHIIHRPFSYAFALLAIIHIGIALSMGYRLQEIRKWIMYFPF